MDSLAFIAALGVGVAVIIWYLANEARGSQGDFGIFAVESRPSRAGADEADAEAARYRTRARLTPDRRAGLHTTDAEKAYRRKPAEKPTYRIRPAQFAAADKEY